MFDIFDCKYSNKSYKRRQKCIQGFIWIWFIAAHTVNKLQIAISNLIGYISRISINIWEKFKSSIISIYYLITRLGYPVSTVKNSMLLEMKNKTEGVRITNSYNPDIPNQSKSEKC